MLCEWECDGREQSVGRVAGVFDNPPGFPCTPPGVDILEGGKLTSNNVAGSYNVMQLSVGEPTK